MKNLWNKCKWIFLFLINVLPFALDVIFYHTGSTDELFLFLPIFAGLTLLNYASHFAMLISVVLRNWEGEILW